MLLNHRKKVQENGLEVDIKDIPEDVLNQFYCFARGRSLLVEIVEEDVEGEDPGEEMEGEVEIGGEAWFRVKGLRRDARSPTVTTSNPVQHAMLI